MSAPGRPVVRNRLVVHIHGYQLTTPERFHRRFGRDLATFGTTWSASTETGPLDISERHARWSAQAQGPGWQICTDYRIIRLDDLIAQRHAQPLFRRIVQGLRGLFDFLLDPAIVRYFRYGWRYAIFTLAPAAMIVGAIGAGIVSGLLLAPYPGAALGVMLGLAVTAALLLYAIKRWFLLILLEDWAFASVLVRRLEPDLALRLQEGSRDVRTAIDAGRYDEVLLIGHSLGAALILHLAEILLRDLTDVPAAGAPRRPAIAVLTIGSSVLKIALHSAARDLRRATEVVTSSPAVVWAEYWSPQDVMNFPRTDPAAAMGVTAIHPPIFRKAVFRQMLDPEAFRKLRFDYFRTHNTFFRAATRRSVYDYFMFVCGPFLSADLFREPDGAMNWIDGSGAVVSARDRGPIASDEAPGLRSA